MMRRIPVLLAVASMAPALLAGQQATVYYDHKPGAAVADGRLSYVESGDKAGERRNGEPPRLVIPKGAKACVIIEHANPLLYGYSLAAKPLAAETPSELATLIAALEPLLSAAKGAGAAVPDPIPTVYFGKVALLAEILQQMEEQRLASDTLPLDTTRVRVAVLGTKAEDIERSAADILTRMSAADRESPGVVLATQQRKSLLERITNLRKEVQSAWEKAHDPVCVKLEDKALGVTITVQPKLDTSGFKPQRPTGSVAAFEVTPGTSSVFEVGFGGLVSALINDQRQFGLANGVVTEGVDRSPKFTPTMFASARATRASLLWGTIGFSASDKGLTALFFGISTRFGVAVIGPEMSLGIGLSLTRVAVGLNKGAVGAALPDGIEKIDAIVKTDLRPGLGIMFTLTGISPKSKEKDSAKNDDSKK